MLNNEIIHFSRKKTVSNFSASVSEYNRRSSDTILNTTVKRFRLGSIAA